MPVAIVRATYTEQNALETFFTNLFGWGKTSVIVRENMPLKSPQLGLTCSTVEAREISVHDPS